ncbi:hypothetical protein ACJRO7_009591 [Eucalyptus globulus]|uniref:Uncharacterized protein n=1 Tax=Eucalyptus globulus TaxID=34317 RepID=A0ABD3LE76_EUCGL
MPLLPAPPGTFYGIPLDLQWEQMEHQDPDLLGLTFVQVRAIVMIDTSLPSRPVCQEYVVLYVRRNGRTLGPLPSPLKDDNDGGSIGVE